VQFQPELIPGPTTSILGGSQLPVGPGISQRAAAARTQTVWRWLVLKATSGKPQATSGKRLTMLPG